MNRNKVHERLSKLEALSLPEINALELWKKAFKYKLFANYTTGEIIGWEEHKLLNPEMAERRMKFIRSQGMTDDEFSDERARIEPELFRIYENET